MKAYNKYIVLVCTLQIQLNKIILFILDSSDDAGLGPHKYFNLHGDDKSLSSLGFKNN